MAYSESKKIYMRAYKREWRKRNRDKENGYQQDYRSRNPEKIKMYLRKSRLKHREKRNEELREHYRKNREERLKAVSEYQKKNVKKINAYKVGYRRKQRLKIIEWYGQKCKCCLENRIEFLAIDHVNGNGGEERKKFKPHQIYSRIIKAGYPQSYQILCHNCNSARGFYGYCPHEKEKNGN